MAAQGYIGRAPGESSVIVARQTFTPTGITTNFTFASGYTVGYVDAYLNGARLIEGDDYTATDGSVVGLTTHAQNGDVLELVVYKAFNVSNVVAAKDDFSVGGDLSVTGNASVTGTTTLSGNTTVGTGITLDTNGNVNVSGVLTANSFVGDGTQLTGVGGGSVISGITIREEGSVVGTSGTVVNVNFVGPDVTATAQAGFSTITIAAGGKFINFTDGGSTGITTTAKTKIQNNLEVTGVGTVTGNLTVGGVLTYADVTNVDSIGIITARSHVSIADSILHTGDTDTSIRFPDANTFTVETGGSEALRVDSSQRLLVNRTSTTHEHPLQVQAASGANAVAIAGRSADDQSEFTFYENDNSTILAQIQQVAGYSVFRHRAGYLRFDPGGTSEKMRLDASGRLLITGGNSTSNVSGFESNLQVAGTDADSASILTGRFGDNASAPLFIFHKSRNASINGNTVVADDDILGRVAFYGADGTDYEEAAHIQCQVDGTPNDDSTDMPGRLVFATTADGDHNATERLRIESDGGTIISNAGTFPTSTNETLNVQGEGHNGHGTTNTRSVFNVTAAITSNTNGAGLWIGARTDENTAVIGTRTASGSLAFETYNSGSWGERMRLTSTGRVGVGTDDPSFNMTVAGTGNPRLEIECLDNNTAGLYLNTKSGGAIVAQSTIRTDNDGRLQIFAGRSSESLRFQLDEAGNIDITGITTASQFDATSDVALKENIEVIDEPIIKLSELKGVTFDWKAGGHSVGVIAQDVEKVLPTAVGGNKDQKTVNYNAIIGLLVESVKDQQKQIEELKSLLDK